jgi:A/G-specific adenine glycosylase
VSGAQSLLRWYDRVRRPLPWRRDRDPYRVWVSEVMLQQTRAETVARRFEDFVARFPTLEALAGATSDELLAAWSGLGYYRRALNLRRAAQQLGLGAAIPRRSSELRQLPGIGEYTAAAIASIAFDEAVPVLDGNVERVVARLEAIAGDPKRQAVRRRLRAAAAELVDPARPGDSNQALMELGATVCVPRAPRCPRCPLRQRCRARASGSIERYPGRPRRAATRRVALVAAVVRNSGGRVLLVRAGEVGALLASDRKGAAGAWEVPWIELAANGSGARAAQITAALSRRYGGEWRLGRGRAVVRHAITTNRFVVDVRTATRRAGNRSEVCEGVEAGWFGESEWRELPRSSVVDKILRALPAGVAVAAARRRPARQDVPADDLVVDFAQALGDQRAE